MYTEREQEQMDRGSRENDVDSGVKEEEMGRVRWEETGGRDRSAVRGRAERGTGGDCGGVGSRRSWTERRRKTKRTEVRAEGIGEDRGEGGYGQIELE